MLEVVLSKLLFKCLKWYYSINSHAFSDFHCKQDASKHGKNLRKERLKKRQQTKQFSCRYHINIFQPHDVFFLFFFLTARWGMILLMEEIRPTSWYGEKTPICNGFYGSQVVFSQDLLTINSITWWLELIFRIPTIETTPGSARTSPCARRYKFPLKRSGDFLGGAKCWGDFFHVNLLQV